MKSETFNRLFPLVENGKMAAGPMIAADHLAFLLDRHLIEVNSDADLISEGLLKAYQLYNPDLLIVFADIAVEAEAMGVVLDYPLNGNPHPKTHLTLREAKLTDMASSGRMPELFRAAEIVSRELPSGFPIFFSMKDPFSLAALVQGADDFLASLLLDPEAARELLEICCENQVGLINSICDQGFIPLIGAPMGSGNLIGPDWFARFAKPYVARLFETVIDRNSFRCIHICGEVSSLTESLAELQPDVLSFEDWDAAMWSQLPDTIPMGNVSTFLFTSNDPQPVEKATRKCLVDFSRPCIISTACDLPPKANPVLVKRMMEIAKVNAPPFIPPRKRGGESAEGAVDSLDSRFRGNDDASCVGRRPRLPDESSHFHNITIKPEGTILQTKPGANIKRELERNGHIFLNNCGNRGECLSCAAIFESNPPEVTEREKVAFGENSRLRMTCQHSVTEDISIFLPPSRRNEITKPLSDFKADGGGIGWGIGVDMGSTVVALYLTNLVSGEVVAQHSFLNPQIVFGGDIMSRLEAAKDRLKREELTRLIHSGIERAIAHLCEQVEINLSDIKNIFIAGNSVMSQLFLGHAGEGLERVPFRSILEGQGSIRFESGLIGMSKMTECKLCPIIAGFIGGDTVSAIIAADLDRKNGRRILIDLGTNGEIVLAVDRVLTCTSTAAGPAFEGVGMSSGMPAMTGAIKGFDTDGNPVVIGEVNPVGVCGSGYIVAMANMLKVNTMSTTGLLAKNENGERCWKLNANVSITQEDVRKFQLAKGAVAAGVAMLCKRSGIEPGSLDEIILTGSFGSRVDPKSAIEIGLIPNIPVEKVTFTDNGAGRGAVLCLGNNEYMKRAEQIQQETKVINMGESEEFQELFVLNMHFPGTELNEI